MREMYNAIWHDDLDKVKRMIDKGFDVNTKNSLNQTILMYASKEGNIDIVNLLIESGANIDIKDVSNLTALSYALRNCNTEIIKLLKK